MCTVERPPPEVFIGTPNIEDDGVGMKLGFLAPV
jgi:hypothetical protein